MVEGIIKEMKATHTKLSMIFSANQKDQKALAEWAATSGMGGMANDAAQGLAEVFPHGEPILPQAPQSPPPSKAEAVPAAGPPQETPKETPPASEAMGEVPAAAGSVESQ